jgi:hypothetical protein
MASLLHIKETTIRRIVCDSNGESLALACKALGADRAQFTTIFLLVDYRRFGRARPTGHIEKIARIYDQVSQARAHSSMQIWDFDRATQTAKAA